MLSSSSNFGFSAIEAILQRKISIDSGAVQEYLAEKKVLITGSGGTVGSALAIRMLDFRVKEIILLEQDENRLRYVAESLELAKARNPQVHVISVLADIKDQVRLNNVFNQYKPQVVFHSAALKFVPMTEANPGEAFKVNVLGTRNILNASDVIGVERFIYFSSGKAADFFLSSVLGYTKRLAEMLAIANGSSLPHADFDCTVHARY